MKRVFIFTILMCTSSVALAHQGKSNNNFPPIMNITGRTDDVKIARINKPQEATSFIGKSLKDMNNDGYDDIILQEYRDDAYNVQILFGGNFLSDDSEIDLSASNVEFIRLEDFLIFYMKIGDLHGDGIKDIILMGADRGGGGTSKIYIIERGPYTSTNRIINKDGRNNSIQIYPNSSIVGATDFYIADLNNDRIDDIIFHHSVPNPVIWATDTGIEVLFIVYGSNKMPSRINVENTPYPLTMVAYDTTYDNFRFGGFSVGNFNYDNRPELILQHGIRHDYSYEGMVRQPLLFRGLTILLYGDLITKPDSGTATIDMRIKRNGIMDFTTNMKKDYDKMGNVNMEYIETRLAAGDINGDGFDDAIISYYKTIENDKELSHIYVLFGTSDLLYGSNLDEMDSGLINMYGNFGDGSNFDCGDINGDGYNDLLIGCTDNWFYIVYGSDSFPENIYLATDTSHITTVTGAKLAGSGDINNDGYSDIVANGSDGIYILFGSGETHPMNLAASHDVPRGRESRFNYSFSNATSFQFEFRTGRPENNTKFILANYGKTLPDSLGDIPWGDGVVSFFNTELTNMSSSFRLNCSFGYTDSLVYALGIKEIDLSVSYWGGGMNKWTRVSVERDTVLNRVSFTTDHLSLWALADINDPVISSVDDKNGSIPQAFEIFQNYPNPFNPLTTIRYHVPKAAEVYLKVYNILGQEIKTLVNKYIAEGNYEIQWDGTDNHGRPVSSGIYIYRMTTSEGFADSKKMLLLR